MIDIRINTDPLRLALTDIQREAFPQAAARSVNRTAQSVESHAISDVAKQGGIRRKDVRSSFTRSRATNTHWVAVISATGRPIALINFNARQIRKGVSAKAWGQRKVYKGVFIAKMKSGHIGVYKREGKGRLPIKELWGPSVPKLMADAAIATPLAEFGRQRLAKELEANLAYYVKRAMARRGGK